MHELADIKLNGMSIAITPATMKKPMTDAEFEAFLKPDNSEIDISDVAEYIRTHYPKNAQA